MKIGMMVKISNSRLEAREEINLQNKQRIQLKRDSSRMRMDSMREVAKEEVNNNKKDRSRIPTNSNKDNIIEAPMTKMKVGMHQIMIKRIRPKAKRLGRCAK